MAVKCSKSNLWSHHLRWMQQHNGDTSHETCASSEALQVCCFKLQHLVRCLNTKISMSYVGTWV